MERTGDELAINEHETARRLQVSVGALRKWRREGEGPVFVRLGRCVRYKLSDLLAYLDQNAVETRKEACEGEAVCDQQNRPCA